MEINRITNWQKCALALALIVAGYELAKKKLPPFEDGFHGEVVRAAVSASPASGPMIAGCPVFPADNVWNTTVDKLPKHPQSDAYTASMGPAKKIHPDFGTDLNSGIPYTLLKPDAKRVKVDFEYRDDSDLGNYPVPPDAPIEGGRAGTGDRHVILIEPERCMLFELFAAQPQPDGTWKAGSGVKIDLTSNALRAEGKTSADAAGLPILPGLIRYDEVAAGEIKHAIRFTVPVTQKAHVWPATHDASSNKSPAQPPLGLRVRLRADFDIAKYSKANQVILTAMKRYGMLLADNGSSYFISGVADKRWDDDDLHHLSDVKGEDFEAVDESGLQMAVDSGRVDPKASH